ncbi:hypothetical protein AB0958_18550 [Streptomyces sp. NPDC006655]|uniref:hypothetical protein n=1 Tax=Streptomyces sp. NPDC006655 TaxID=3156898 RepID=UPI003453A596
MTQEPIEAEAIKPRPDYPPKTPPPPKKPPSPPPPDPPRSDLLAGLPVPQRALDRSGRPVMRNRRGASWTLEAAPWAAGKAAGHVADQLADWSFAAPDSLADVVRLLVATAVSDGGRRISVHLSEQDGMALILCLGHQHAESSGDDVLDRLHNLGADSCGTEMTPEGRQVWALLAVRATVPTTV